MKRFLTLSLASILATLSLGVAFAAEDESINLPTRTLRARHANTTGSPEYADMDIEDQEEEEDIVAFDEYSFGKQEEAEAAGRLKGDQSEEEVIIQDRNDGLIEEEDEIIEETDGL